MKFLTLAIILSINFLSSNIALAKSSLSGKITDVRTGEPIPGVTIYLPDLKIGTTSDFNGNYKIENLPTTILLVHVSFIGYKTIIDKIDLSTTTTKDFAMEETVAELNEVVVTGVLMSSEKNRTPTPISSISSVQLKQLSVTNIIDAIATQPGVAQITTGSGISKPVIRGLGFNRVLVVNDGIRQEGQQWGSEHGIEIDEYSVSRVEILKGPASLSYGSDAMGGVINMLPAATIQDGKISGTILSNFQSNNGLWGNSFNVAGNKHGFIWNLRYSNKQAHSYKNRYDGYVFNSGFRESNSSALLGINKSWGYSHLQFSSYNLTPGIVEGERDSVTGKFIKPVVEPGNIEGEAIATDEDFKSYTPLTPYQKIHHYKLVSNNTFILGAGSIKAILGWQQNRRQEYSDILNEGNYGLYFFMNTLNYDVRYNFPEENSFNVSVGSNGMFQQSQNKGTEFLIPDYHLFDAGVFVMASKSYDQLDLSGGIRFDNRKLNATDLWLDENGDKTETPNANSYQQFSGINSNYQGVSGSLGATYQFEGDYFMKLNLSKGYRAPNIAEISSNGAHEGSINYIIGVPSLKPENSWQVDYALGTNSKHITVEADLFYNYINNFIYLQKLQSTIKGDSLTDGYRTFKYTSGNAHLMGGEISFDIHPHPLDWLHFENSFSYVKSIQANQPDSMKYLPFTPAPKFSTELRANKNKLGKHLANAYLKLGIDKYFDQRNFYAAFNTETETPGYTLINLGIGADVLSKKHTLFSIYVTANNLTDVAYQSHLSRLKYAAENYVTGRTGVYNMGRNISFKLVIPFDGKI